MQANEFRSDDDFDLYGLVFKFYVIVCFFSAFVKQWINSPLLNFLDDAVLLALFFLAIIEVKPAIKRWGGLQFGIVSFIGLSIFIAAVSSSGIAAALMQLRQYKNIFLLFLLLDKKHYQFALDVLEVMLYVSIPVSILQFTQMKHWDEVTGLFGYGATGTVSILMVFFVVRSFAQRLLTGQRMVGWYMILPVLSLLNETKITFVLLPILIISVVIVSGRVKFDKVVLLFLAAVPFLYYANLQYEIEFGRTLTESFTYENLYDYLWGDDYYIYANYFAGQEEFNDPGRLARIKAAIDAIFANGTFSSIFGYGMGASYAGGESGIYGLIAADFVGTALNTGSRVQAAHVLIDFGFIGLIFIICLIFYILYISGRRIASDRYYLQLDVFIMSMILFFCLVYQNILFSKEFTVLYFVAMTIFLGDLRNEKADNS
ncbi:hypothetical protein [Vogesella mureinivorans]|uniref:hypothetical protein n=1 Tax=Vogesella mureinivorans TaxID=657276 RepID=UPI0011C7A4C8|nr:hypothetical protein [Vogesella mureinivorans]